MSTVLLILKYCCFHRNNLKTRQLLWVMQLLCLQWLGKGSMFLILWFYPVIHFFFILCLSVLFYTSSSVPFLWEMTQRHMRIEVLLNYNNTGKHIINFFGLVFSQWILEWRLTTYFGYTYLGNDYLFRQNVAQCLWIFFCNFLTVLTSWKSFNFLQKAKHSKAWPSRKKNGKVQTLLVSDHLAPRS